MWGLRDAGGHFTLAGESISFAFSSFTKNKLRGFLSLLGVSIGIFCITAAMTIVDSLESSLRNSLESFGGNTIFVEKIPLEPDLNEDGVFRWWNYLDRPEPRFEEYRFLEERLSDKASVAFSRIYENGKVVAVSENWRIFLKNGIETGREFSASELSGGASVAVAGANVALNGPGETVYVGGRPVRVIGRLKRGGTGAVDMYDADNAIIVPYLWAAGVEGLQAGKSTISVLPQDFGGETDLLGSVETALRSYRRLKPGVPSDFSLNRLSFVIEEMEHIFEILGKIAWVIGLFSLAVGGFGVANIMFVAVKERTREIGLQKALGANAATILFQYLAEAAAISIAGGLMGVLLAWLLCLALPMDAFQMSVSAATVSKALLTALSIGIVSGLAPAASAANLPPAVALNKK